MKLVSQECQAQAEAEVGHGGHLFLGHEGLGKEVLETEVLVAVACVEAFSSQMKAALEQLRESVSRLPLDRTTDLDPRHPTWRNPPRRCHAVHLTVARSYQATHQNSGSVVS